jgi:cyanophycin synthetase
MNFRRLHFLRGPNVWARCPVLEAALDLGGGPWSVEQIRQTLDCLRGALPDTTPGAAGHDDVTLEGLAEAFGRVALRLQELAGNPVSFADVRPTHRRNVFLTAVEFAEEPVGQAAAATALRLLQAAREGKRLPPDEDLRRLRDLAYERRLPASTAVIYHAARARGLPAGRLNPEYGRYLRLGQGAKQHRCLASEPDTASAVARMASTDKYLAKQLLAAQGVPVPQGRLVTTAEQAWAAASDLGLPVAVKPVDSDLATGVSLDLRTREQVEAGFRDASEHSAEVLVECFAPGVEHRVLVASDRVVAVTRIAPPHVIGDGVSTVAALVDGVNSDPRRGDEGSGAPLYKIKTDDVARAVLTGQGYTLDSVPPAGAQVLLRRNPPYFKNGGRLVDLTDQIHPSTAAHAVAAAHAVQLPVAGLDVVAIDISRPLEEQGGVVVEINTSPGLWLHMAPWADNPRPVGEEIVASLFPPGTGGRIPVVAVVGDATGSATRHLAGLLTRAGLRVGTAGAAEVAVGERRWAPRTRTPQERAGVLMENTTVDVALLQTSPRELVRAGFGNDRCDVAIVLAPGSTEDDPDAVATTDEFGPEPGEFLGALRHALAPEGVFVLPAEVDPAKTPPPVEQVLLVAGREESPRVHEHFAAGGRALVVRGDALLVVRGREAPLALGKRPGSLTEAETSGLLAALAAGLALGLGAEALRTHLGSLP